MPFPKNKGAYALGYTIFLAHLFILTAWKAFDDPGKNISAAMQPMDERIDFCFKELDSKRSNQPDGLQGILLPANQDIGRDFEGPVIENTTFPALGDKLRTACDFNPPVPLPLLPGGPQSWDFSSLVPEVAKVTYYQSPSAGTVARSYPTADLLVIDGSGTEYYYDVTPTAFSLLGRYGYNLEGDLEVYMNLKYSPPLPQRYAPFKFVDIIQNTSNILTGFAASSIPKLLAFVPTADSFRIRITYQQLDVGDAYGDFSLPGQTFEVLRQKRTLYKSVAVDVKVVSSGWIDISTIGGQQILTLGTDTITSLTYLI